MKTFLSLFARLFSIDTPIGRCEMWATWLLCILFGVIQYIIIEADFFYWHIIDFQKLDVFFSFAIIPLALFYVVLLYINIRNIKSGRNRQNITVYSIIFLCILGLYVLTGKYNEFSWSVGNYEIGSVFICIILLFFVLALFRRLSSVYSLDFILKDFLKISVLTETFFVFFNFAFISFSQVNTYIGTEINISCVFLVFMGFYVLRFLVAVLFIKEKVPVEEEKLLSKEEIKIKIKQNFISLILGIWKFIIKIFDFKGTRGRGEFFIAGTVSFVSMIILFLKGSLWDLTVYGTAILQYDNYNNSDVFWGIPDVMIIVKFLAFMLGIFIVCLSLYIGRLRSLKLSPWWVLGFFLFPLNIVLMLYCIFGKSRK